MDIRRITRGVYKEDGMTKAVIIGASSGIGRALAVLLAKEGYALGLAARRLELLKELRQELGGNTYVTRMDIAQPEEAVKVLDGLISDMGGMDMLIICSGTGHINRELEWDKERETIDVNVKGFTAIAGAGMKYFLEKGEGHLAAISSVAALRGSGTCPAYNASKAYMSNYLEGLSVKVAAAGKHIAVTDIKPGLVDTAMAKGEGLIWVAPAEKAAKQIWNIIKRSKAGGYVTKRWRLVALLFNIMPRRLYIKGCIRSEGGRLKDIKE
jgi:short-subunit dehydrogenase